MLLRLIVIIIIDEGTISSLTRR